MSENITFPHYIAGGNYRSGVGSCVLYLLAWWKIKPSLCISLLDNRTVGLWGEGNNQPVNENITKPFAQQHNRLHTQLPIYTPQNSTDFLLLNAAPILYATQFNRLFWLVWDTSQWAYAIMIHESKYAWRLCTLLLARVLIFQTSYFADISHNAPG